MVGSPPDYDSYDYDYGRLNFPLLSSSHHNIHCSSDIGEGEEDFVETFMECYDTGD